MQWLHRQSRSDPSARWVTSSFRTPLKGLALDFWSMNFPVSVCRLTAPIILRKAIDKSFPAL